MGSRIIATKDLMPGSVLADAVVCDNGKILLSKDIVLTRKHISLLNVWDVKKVIVRIKEDAVVAKPLPRIERRINSETYLKFIQEYDSIVANTAQSFDFIKKMAIIPVSRLKETAGKIISTILTYGSSVINYLLAGNHKLSDFITHHSVMVAFFAGTIANQMKWNEEDIKGVTLAGLLHDVGNLTSGKVNPRVQSNIAGTASLLKGVKGLSSETILGIVQHREYVDGSGYPTGANDCQIHPYAKIIAVADAFHTQAYTDEDANPFPALAALAKEMFGKLDAFVCHAFINRVRDSLLNSKILLSDGQEAEVIYFYPNDTCLPIVKTTNNCFIDLSKHRSSTICRVLPK